MAETAIERESGVVERASAALEGLGDLLCRVTLNFAEDTLTVEGEAVDVAQKKRALHRVGAVEGVGWVNDRLRVRPAARMTDGAICAALCNRLQQDRTLVECTLTRVVQGHDEPLSEPLNPKGHLRIRVDGGVVTLDGDLPSRTHKRLAGVVAWWVPGTRDVVDGLRVNLAGLDCDEDLADTIRTVLERDPFVDAMQFRVSADGGLVTLAGTASSDAEKEIVELDAWYVFGVDSVNNEIEVLR